MPSDHPVVSSLLPVVLLILVGVVTGKMKLIRQEAVRDLSNLVFLVLTQALLFRTSEQASCMCRTWTLHRVAVLAPWRPDLFR